MEPPLQELSTLEKDLIGFLKAHDFYNKTISCMFTIKIKPEKEKEWKENLHKVIPQIRKEEGCLNYEVSQDIQDPTTFGVYEKWADGPALEFHFKCAYTKEFLASFEHIVVDVKSNIMKPL